MRAVGMRVVVYDPALTAERAMAESVERAGSLEGLLSAADVVSSACAFDGRDEASDQFGSTCLDEAWFNSGEHLRVVH
jgi:hypothetical protein